jgi:hypothetical protein
VEKVNLGDESIDALLKLPETGMGFQLVQANVLGQTRTLLVFSGVDAYDVTGLSLEPGEDPATVLRNGLKMVDALKDNLVVRTLFVAPPPAGFRLLHARIPAAAATPAAPPVVTALPSSLVKKVTLLVDRKFHRFSAFKPDRRITSTGDFVPGTYAVPESELPFLPTGFAVVGRLALPSPLPASHHYEISAKSGTVVEFGTVAPAYGQAGGGVEAYFAHGATNAASSPATHVDLEDE